MTGLILTRFLLLLRILNATVQSELLVIEKRVCVKLTTIFEGNNHASLPRYISITVNAIMFVIRVRVCGGEWRRLVGALSASTCIKHEQSNSKVFKSTETPKEDEMQVNT